MRTSMEISDPLFRRARQLANERGVTMRSLVEDGLRRVLDEPSLEKSDLELVTYGRGGMREKFTTGGWDAIAAELYPEDKDLTSS